MNNDGGINYVELERTADAIERGIAYIDRLSLAEEQGRTKGGRRNVEASVLLGRAYSSKQNIISAKSGKSRTEAENGERIEQEQLLEAWAKEKGIFEEWDIATSRTPYSMIGTESRVYIGSTQDTVIKITMPYMFSNTPLSFLDNRISLHNYLFPETAYKLIGLTRKNKMIAFILEQPVIDNKNYREMSFSDSELLTKYKEDMKKRGFIVDTNKYTRVINKDYVVSDLHENNVLISNKGNFFFIDTISQLNTTDGGFGGTREYGSGNIILIENQSSKQKQTTKGNF